MYKRDGEVGKTSYRDQPCDAGGRQTDAEGCVTGRLPAIQCYELGSADWQGMRADLERKKINDAQGQSFHGLATWKVGYTFQWSRSADGHCTISALTPNFQGEIRMPRRVAKC